MTAATTASASPADQHGIRPHSEGGWDTAPVQTRSERFTSTDPSAFPAVTSRQPGWQYSPVDRISDLTDGALDGSRLPIGSSPAEGVTLTWMHRDEAPVGRCGLPEERASANAWSSAEGVTVLRLTGEEDRIVTLHRGSAGTEPRAAHTIVEAEPFSKATVVFENTGAARLSENVEIHVGEGADLTLITVQQWDDDAVHLASHFARLERDARLRHVVVSLTGAIVRVNPTLHLAGEGSDGEAFGLYFSDAGQHLESQVYVHHEAPHTRSRVNYKGALQGKGARSVWIGDVLIGRGAAGTDSYEQNRNLVLTDGTRADSVPNLEIETGDIAGAGHASATGRFDDEQLFYLQARGIPEDEARRLVVRGFLSEIVQQIGVPDLQERLEAALEAELGGSRETA